MTPEEREQFYDREIAPALMQLAGKCQDHGLSMVAVVEWDPGETGRTVCIAGSSGFGIRMVEASVRAAGNVDALIFALMKYGRENGHSSICLKMLEGRV